MYISRWKALGILLTALVVCMLAVPNFFPEKTVQGWPKWAQRHVVLGLDLQGGLASPARNRYRRGAQGATRAAA
jgi:preprotein translocase subunit SecD